MHVVLQTPRAVDVLLNTLAAERFVRKALLHDVLDSLEGSVGLSHVQPLVVGLLARVAEPHLDEHEFQSAVAAIRGEVARVIAGESFVTGTA